MVSVVLDTHKVFKRLIADGVSDAESEALVETARELSDTPTRSDLKELESVFIKWMISLLGVVTALILSGMWYLISDVRNDIRDVRHQVLELSMKRQQ